MNVSRYAQLPTTEQPTGLMDNLPTVDPLGQSHVKNIKFAIGLTEAGKFFIEAEIFFAFHSITNSCYCH